MIRIFSLLVALTVFISTGGHAQSMRTKNLVVITFDGYRWKDLFTGADSALLFGKKYTSQDSAARIRKYWGRDPEERREKLMPFFWSTVARQGQVFGNRLHDNFVNVKNPYWFSYPGYNEIFTGYPDTLINSNSFPPNPNVNIWEFANRLPDFAGKVSIFTSWEAFPRILNAGRSGLPVNSAYTDVKGDNLTAVQRTLNEMQHWLPKDYGSGERPDAITYELAKEELTKNHPRIVQLSFIETDALAHAGKYDFYLDAARNCDAMIADLWNLMQKDPFYKDQTTFVITEDHGRGEGDEWRHHNSKIVHANEIFFAVMGPDTKPEGEHTASGQIFQNQFAQTFARFLGISFRNGHETGEPIEKVLKR